jgi:hypothetical protein
MNIEELKIQFEVAKPVIDKFLAHLRARKASSILPYSHNRAEWFDGDIESLNDLTHSSIKAMVYHIQPQNHSARRGRSFENVELVKNGTLTVNEAVTLWSALTIIQSERENEVKKPSSIVIRNLQRAANESAEYDYYRSLFDVYSQQRTPEPEELTEQDILDLN